MPPISVLIKPASGKCNLRCKYCFYCDIALNRSTMDFGMMSEATLGTIVAKTMDFADGLVTFSFQGGEPTLRGLNFFQKLIEFESKHNNKSLEVQNCIQTNGILLDNEWAHFLKENHFLVGLSLDGPEDIHDAYRINAKGKGTYKDVMAAAETLNKHEVDFNILVVVTNRLAENADRAYTFFSQNDFRFLQIIPCIDPMGFERGSHDFSLTPEKYADFLKIFFDRWSEELLQGKEVSVRYFDNLVRIVMGMPPETCSMMGSCRCQFVFEADGSCYPCDFYVTDEWRMGNINEMDILELYSKEVNKLFIRSSLKTAPECQQCKWRFLCRGGCRRDREDMKKHTLGLNYYCSAYYEFLTYAYPKLLKLANYIKSLNGGK